MSEEKNVKEQKIIEKSDGAKIENTNKKGKFKLGTVIIVSMVGVLCLWVGFSVGKDKGRKLPATYKKYSDSKVIATVGDVNITGKELKQKMYPLFFINGKNEMPEDKIKAYEQSMMDYITTTEVLYLEGTKDGIKASKEEIETEYATLMADLGKQFGLTEQDFDQKFNISKSEMQKQVEKEIVATKYIGKASEVSDKEAQKYYEKNKDEFLKVRASHILIKNKDKDEKDLSDSKKKENKEKAQEILKKAKQGESFEELAKEYSQDISAANGGDLEFFGKGQMVEPFEKAVFNLKVGQISDSIVETEYGYHIIKKTGEKEDEFDTIKEDLKYKLSYEKQKNTVDNLIEKYKVDIKEI